MAQIEQDVIDRLFALYTTALGLNQTSQDAFKNACQFIEDNLPNHFDWDELNQEKEQAYAELLSILEPSLIYAAQNGGENLEFNEPSCRIALLPIQQKLTDAKQIYWLRDINATGIQEKYLKSQLSAQESLTTLDMKRFVLSTGMEKTIRIANFSVEEMGTILCRERQNHNDSRESYSIPFMVNLHDQIKETTPQWASLIITVDPLSNNISYKMTSEEVLDEAQKKKIESAIRYEANIPGKNYSAFPDAPDISGDLKTLKDKTGKPSGGYSILHHLYEDEALANEVVAHTKATKFAKLEPNLRTIRNEVYEIELSAIKLNPQLTGILNRQMQENFHDGQIKPEALARVVSYVGAPVAEILAQHPVVAGKLSELQIFHSKVNFPGQTVDSPLSSSDYQLFLLLVNEKFKSTGIDKSLDELVIKGDSAALEGLIAYNDTNSPLPFKTLTLDLTDVDLSDESVQKHFLFNLKTMLLTMSENNLPALKFLDPQNQLNANAVKEIAEFIQKRPVAIDISLPEAYQSSREQKEIDAISSNNIRQKNLQTFDKKTVTPSDEGVVKAQVRKREQLGKQSVSIDIELQQEQQVEVAVESTVEQGAGVDLAGTDNDQIIYNFAAFQDQFQNGQLDKGARSYLVSSSNVNTEELWNTWFGFLTVAEAKITKLGLSKASCEELLAHHDQFKYGLDLKNLPSGFSLKKQGFMSFIDFDPNLKLISQYNPLQVQAKELPKTVALSHEQLNTWLATPEDHPVKNAWNTLNQGTYNKSAQQTFRQFLPQMLLLNPEQLNTLFALSFNEEREFNAEKLQFLLENSSKLQAVFKTSNHDNNAKIVLDELFGAQATAAKKFIKNYQETKPDFAHHVLQQLVSAEPQIKEQIEQLIRKVPEINLNSVMQVYIQAGGKGIDALNRIVDQDVALFKQLNNDVWVKNNNYMPLLEEKHQDAMQTISGFTSNDLVWFNTLLKQHGEAQDNVDLVDMVNAFKQFRAELKKIQTPNDIPLILPAQCNLQQVKSLPVALSRIIELMTHVKEINRIAQWNEISSLDFSSNGAIKTIASDYDWAFITPEMQVNAEHERNNTGTASTLKRYWRPSDWNNIRRDNNSAVEDFYRFIAAKGRDRQQPLEFYRYAQQKIESAAELSLEDKERLYVLTASTTAGANAATIKSLEETKKDFDVLFDMIIKPPLPIPIPETYRNTIRTTQLRELMELKNAPPLPIMSKMMLLISGCYTSLNPATLIENDRKLGESFDTLKNVIDQYKNLSPTCVYDGFKDYNDDDYKKRSLFFDHVATLQAIETQFIPAVGRNVAIDLVRLISSFKLGINDFDTLRTEIFHDSVDLGSILRQKDLFYILKHISVQGERKTLNGNDLIELCHAVKNSSEELMDVVKGFQFKNGSSLIDYLPAEFVEHYGKKGLSPEVEEKIGTHFNENQQIQIKNMLLRFSGPTDSAQYDNILSKIISICEPLSRTEKNIFISKLSSGQGLYTEVRLLDDEKNHFVQLLDFISTHNATDDFINLMAAERNLLRNTPQEHINEFFVTVPPEQSAVANLDQKTILYLETILPTIRDFKNSNVSEVDITPRILDIILKTPTKELTAESSVIRPEMPYFTKQQTELETILHRLKPQGDLNSDLLTQIIEGFNNQLDFKSQIESIDDFMQNSGVEDTSLLQNYKEKLEEINNREFSTQDALELAINPAFLSLAVYLVSPESMPEKEQQLFEEHYQDKLTAIISKYPDLLLNKDLINNLLFNNKFLNEVGKGDALDAVKSPDLFEDDTKLTAFVAALDKDLKGVAEFRNQTKNVQRELNNQQKELSTYPKVFTLLYQKIDTLAGENPNSKKQFLDLFDRYLQSYSPEKNGELLNYLNNFVDIMQKSFAKTEDKNIVLSLCLQFNSDNDKELIPERLINLLEMVNGLPEQHQAIVLKTAVALINNEKDYNFRDYKELCALVKTNPQFADTLVKLYSKAPFPDCGQVMQMHKIASGTGTENYDATMAQIISNFEKHPCRRDPRNGFKPEHAEKQLEKLKINGNPPTPQEIAAGKVYFQKFQQITMDAREKSIDELLKTLESYKGKELKTADYDTLVATAAELLHRSKGQDSNSMEINTTQYLAILTSIKTPGHVTSQIGTGEGKSRIMMISLACQHALGNTVDFVTSDAQLATRDYVEFQSYFELVGAKTSMIFAGSDPTQYQKGGINFSDPSNLSLFRNKARSLGLGDLVLDEDPKKRALLLDEADKTYFDVADTRFNFSKEGDENIREMQWSYPLLMEYFAQESFDLKTPIEGKNQISPLELYYADIDASREKFIQFASGHCTTPQLMRLKALSNAQIEQWQVSAVTASQLKFKEDFVIEADTLISTPQGPKISSEAQLLFGNRVAKSSKFSFGVHQCLHARLNLARQNANRESDPLLREELARCEQAFYVPDEKQIVYSTTSKNLLDDYDEGTLKAVTGTTGSILEREEARELYGEKTNKMQFIDVPRDKGLNRRDKAMQLTKNENKQFKTLVRQIKEAQEKNQPILIIAENDEESLKLFEKLNKLFKEDIQHIHSQLSLKDEKNRVNNAGRPGQITVATDMIGRGTDIALKGAAKTNGLNVMLTYLPRMRDMEQIIGRSGRFGAQGETSLILDKQRLKTQLGKEALGSKYYRNTEAYIEREQAIMDRNKQCERLIKNTVGDFRKTLTNNFFEDMLQHADKAEHKKLMPAWTAFFDKSDKAWNEQWPRIQKELQADTIDINIIQACLDEYKESTQKTWTMLHSNIKDIDAKYTKQLNIEVPNLDLNETSKNLITNFDLSNYSAANDIVYDYYSPGHDGRTVNYTHWYIPVVATLKGLANLLPGVHLDDAREPFADFRAWLNGTGKLFPDAANNFADMQKFMSNSANKISSIFDGQRRANEVPAVPQEKHEENSSYGILFKTGIITPDSVINNINEQQNEKSHQDPEPEFKSQITAGVKNEGEDADKSEQTNRSHFDL